MHSPHLPPQSCNVKMHRVICSLPYLILIVIISLIAGAAASLATVAWIAPTVVTEYPMYRIDSGQRDSSISVDPLLQRQTKQKVLTVYDNTKKVGGYFYSHGARISQLATLSSDGWVVGYIPGYIAGDESKWEIVDYQGIVRNVEKVVPDKLTDLVYIQISGGGLRVISFADQSGIEKGEPYWYLSGNKIEFTEMKDVSEMKGTMPIWKNRVRYLLSSDTPSGQIILDENGKLVGFSRNDNTLLHGEHASYYIDSILDSGLAVASFLPIAGHMIEGMMDEDSFDTDYVGYFVDFSLTKSSSSSIGVGDVIEEINGHQVESSILFELATDSPSSVNVKINRGGRSFRIKVDKMELKLEDIKKLKL